MLEQILYFINKLNPEVVIQAPSRINLINPLDAVEGDFWMPSVAINGVNNPLSAFVYIKSRVDSSFVRLYSIKNISDNIIVQGEKEEVISKHVLEFKKKFNEDFKLFYASVYRFIKTCSVFLEKFKNNDFEIGLITTIPRQSGLGGSAAIIIAILYGFAKYFGLYKNLTCINKEDFPINRDIIAEMATKVEDDDLKITAGYGDRYVIARGGLSFCSYYGKLHHKELSMEPLAIYDRIDLSYDIKSLPIIICFSGVSHESGSVHEKLRKVYLHKDPKILNCYRKLAEISWKSRFAIMKQDWNLLGKYFRENTAIMNDIMRYVGFIHGIGLANNILISLIEDHPDVYAAKLTGAGGGGSVFALVNPEKIDKVLHDWKHNLNDVIDNKETFLSHFPLHPLEIRQKLKKAQFFRIKIVSGVKKL